MTLIRRWVHRKGGKSLGPLLSGKHDPDLDQTHEQKQMEKADHTKQISVPLLQEILCWDLNGARTLNLRFPHLARTLWGADVGSKYK